MFDTPDQALEGIKQLGLPAVFVDIFKGGGSKRFRLQYDAPTRFFQVKQSLVATNPRLEKYLPILEMNREAIYAYDTEEKRFVEYYYGDREAAVIGDNYQQFMGSLFVDLGYAGLESLVKEVAADFDFRHVDRLEGFLATDDDLNSAEAKRRFVTSLA